MKMMVKQAWNGRLSEPKVSASKGKLTDQGGEIEVAEIIQGENYQGVNTWIKDTAGEYYWGGVVDMYGYYYDKVDEVKKRFGVPAMWTKLNTYGIGSKVLVIDTGTCLNHQDLKINAANSNNLLNPGQDADDWDGHGTMSAGIIAGTGFNQVVGVAPQAELHITKIVNYARTGFNNNLIASAIKNGTQNIQDLQVISISGGVATPDTRIENAIKLAAEKNIVVVCAIGNLPSAPNYPALYAPQQENIISVGSVNMDSQLSSFSIQDNCVVIHGPGENIYSTYTDNGYHTDSGTSFSTPFITGVVALIRSKFPQMNAKSIRDKMVHSSRQLTSQTGNYTYKVININQLINEIP